MLNIFKKNKKFKEDKLETDIDMICIELNFEENQYINLEDYLSNRRLNSIEILSIIKRVANIFEYIEKKGCIVGSINISDFWIKDSDLTKITYKINRRLLKPNDELLNYEKGKLCAPEVVNDDSKNIDTSTDVFILGKLAVALIFNNRINIEGYSQERYISYNLNLFDTDLPIELHSFLGKTTSLLKESRFDSIKSCNKSLKNIINNTDKRCVDKEKGLRKFEYSSKTNVGNGKLKIHKSKGRKAEFANEDSYILLSHKNKLFFMVADGVTNSKYGTGYEASNIVRDMSEYLWEKSKDAINTQLDVEKFYKALVNLCNESIFRSLSKNTNINNLLNRGESLDDIMATTFSSGIIINDNLYYTSLGDSPIYILSDENNLSLLNKEDNIGNEILKESMLWNKYQSVSSKSTLTKYIGKVEVNNGTLQASNLEVCVKKYKLLDKDILIACSDGLTDYVSGVGRIDDIWMADESIKDIFMNNKEKTLDEINDILIQNSNKNGGMDNITSILIQFYFDK